MLQRVPEVLKQAPGEEDLNKGGRVQERKPAIPNQQRLKSMLQIQKHARPVEVI